MSLVLTVLSLVYLSWLLYMLLLDFFVCGGHPFIHSFVSGHLILFLICLAGGVFKLELFLPEEYPMAAPKVIFLIENK